MIILWVLSFLVITLATVNILAQALYAAIGMVSTPAVYPAAPRKRFAVVICARNEENVIANLLTDIRKQHYDHDKLDVFVVADNCTDETAKVARENGANVFERFNQDVVGKGFALTYVFDKLLKLDAVKDYDAFFIFDADNRLSPNYVAKMNDAFASGYDIVTSYRNSSNFGENWVAAGSALWFIRESRLYNNSRQRVNLNAHVGGTGFMFRSDIITRDGGWIYHLITEDLEFSMAAAINGYRIGYCEAAVFYDEQPITFVQSWNQRLRWSKGFLQVYWHYGPKLLRASIAQHSISFIDFSLLIFPWMVVSLLRIGVGFLYAGLGFVSLSSQIDSTVSIIVATFLGSLGLMALAIITVFVERKNINVSAPKLLFYSLLFPIFLLSYVPISFVAIFKKVRWTRIAHTGVMDG